MLQMNLVWYNLVNCQMTPSYHWSGNPTIGQIFRIQFKIELETSHDNLFRKNTTWIRRLLKRDFTRIYEWRHIVEAIISNLSLRLVGIVSSWSAKLARVNQQLIVNLSGEIRYWSSSHLRKYNIIVHINSMLFLTFSRMVKGVIC